MKKTRSYILHAALIAVAATMLFPLFWMILLSLKSVPENFSTFWETISSRFTLSNYSDALSTDRFGMYFLNSIIVSGVITAGNVLFCLMSGYALARKEFRGKGLLLASVLGVLIIPPHIIMIPLYRLIVEFDWINTYQALILPWIVAPFGVFLVWQYVKSMPREIEYAARIDGAGELYILFRIVAPLAKPILTALAIYQFLNSWNSFLFPFLFTNDELHRTLPVGLAFYLGKQSIDWGHLMAGASISALPILIIFSLFQRQIIKGLTAGSLKE